MSLNDQAEKITLAKDYLLTYSPNTQEFEAAAEHLKWVAMNGDWEDRARVTAAVREIHNKRGAETSILNKLEEYFS